MGVDRLLVLGDHPVLIYAPTTEIRQVVVYIHGYAIDRQIPWVSHDPYCVFAERVHGLGPQFHNAVDNGVLVLIPESPIGKNDMVKWMNSARLLDHVEKAYPQLKIPERPAVSAIGHSGAYRTLFHWLKDDSVVGMHLIDALYSYTEDFSRWINDPTPGVATGRRLSLVVGPQGPPRQNSERLVARSLVRARVREPSAPNPELELSDLEAPLFFWRTSLPHMELVKSGKIIPQLLRRVP